MCLLVRFVCYCPPMDSILSPVLQGQDGRSEGDGKALFDLAKVSDGLSAAGFCPSVLTAQNEFPFTGGPSLEFAIREAAKAAEAARVAIVTRSKAATGDFQRPDCDLGRGNACNTNVGDSGFCFKVPNRHAKKLKESRKASLQPSMLTTQFYYPYTGGPELEVAIREAAKAAEAERAIIVDRCGTVNENCKRAEFQICPWAVAYVLLGLILVLLGVLIFQESAGSVSGYGSRIERAVLD